MDDINDIVDKLLDNSDLKEQNKCNILHYYIKNKDKDGADIIEQRCKSTSYCPTDDEIKDAGFTLAEFIAANYNLTQLKNVGFTLSDFKKAKT